MGELLRRHTGYDDKQVKEDQKDKEEKIEGIQQELKRVQENGRALSDKIEEKLREARAKKAS